MQYILDCVTLLLNVVLCFYLLYGKYPVRSTHMVKRILLITAAVISKALIVYLQISPLNFISGCCIILLIIWLLFSCNKAALFMYTAVACHAKRKKLTRKTKKTLLNTTFKSVFYYL